MNEGSHQELVLVAGGTSESVRYCTRCLRGLGHRVLCANTLHELLVMEAREQPDVSVLGKGLEQGKLPRTAYDGGQPQHR